jgi:tRNA1(Val) A37 N6-methylase TrmN6
LPGTFDLVTGTPPYFRVDFETRSEKNESGDREAVQPAIGVAADETEASKRTVVGALIRQGGMPTCKESAPARCEFRGGIEAYCATAKAILALDGTFVVCVNWANHSRAMAAAPAAGLVVTSVLRVVGKEDKPPLFCVYTMKHASPQVGYTEESITEPDLVVRDANGAWTVQYAAVLQDMSYPVASLHPSGAY